MHKQSTEKEKILRIVCFYEQVRPKEIEKLSGIRSRSVCMNLTRLKRERLVKSTNAGPKSVVYSITNAGTAYLRFKDEQRKEFAKMDDIS